MRGIVHQRRCVSAATGVYVDRQAAFALPQMQRADRLVRQPAGRVVADPPRSVPALPVVTSSPELARALRSEPGVAVTVLDEPAARDALLNAKAVLFAHPNGVAR